MLLDTDALILGGATVYMGGLSLWVARQMIATPAPQPWRPKHVREALRFARLTRFAKHLGHGHVPGLIAKATRHRIDFEFCPLPMILIGYFEEIP